jgi:Tfp pilus assembly protein PilF
MSEMRKGLERLLEQGADSAQLRFALATRCQADGDLAAALEHARLALELDPDYSAAWRLRGRVELATGQDNEAIQSFEKGIAVAERKGDQQLVKEMRVFLKRAREGDS